MVRPQSAEAIIFLFSLPNPSPQGPYGIMPRATDCLSIIEMVQWERGVMSLLQNQLRKALPLQVNPELLLKHIRWPSLSLRFSL